MKTLLASFGFTAKENLRAALKIPTTINRQLIKLMLVLQLPAAIAGSSRQQRQGRNTAPDTAEELYSEHFTLYVQPYGKGE